MSRKIAFSASFFNCPAVLAILQSCDEVYTTNQYAVDVLVMDPDINIRLMDGGDSSDEFMDSFPKEDGDTFVTFGTLYDARQNWINDATPEQLEEYRKD